MNRSTNRAAVDAALPPMRRLRPHMNIQECIFVLGEGNPGGSAVMLAVFSAHLPAWMVFLLDLDQAEIGGGDIYTLAGLAGSPLRAAALLHACVHFRLPTLPELQRELELLDRDRDHVLSPALDAAIRVVGEQVPHFQGADLGRPAGGSP